MIAYWADIRAAATAHALDPLLVAGLVATESGGDPWAWNPEPRYRYFWDVKAMRPFRAVSPTEIVSEYAPVDFPTLAGDPDQEWWAQQASWGLMQVMGAVAREHGFSGPYLTGLCDPVRNLVVGCKLLQALLAWARSDAERALAAYNGGQGGNVTRPFRNAAYAAKVLAARERLAGDRSLDA